MTEDADLFISIVENGMFYNWNRCYDPKTGRYLSSNRIGLTSQRPYKDAWTNDEAFATLQRLAGETLDAECVEALVRRREEVERIQEQFDESQIG